MDGEWWNRGGRRRTAGSHAAQWAAIPASRVKRPRRDPDDFHGAGILVTAVWITTSPKCVAPVKPRSTDSTPLEAVSSSSATAGDLDRKMGFKTKLLNRAFVIFPREFACYVEFGHDCILWICLEGA